jgi:hypothetical protein
VAKTLSYYWLVFFDKMAKPAGNMKPFAVTVYHRDLANGYRITMEMQRELTGQSANAEFSRGVDLGNRIWASEFHPDVALANKWMDENWVKLKAQQARYAELHSIVAEYPA